MITENFCNMSVRVRCSALSSLGRMSGDAFLTGNC